MLLHLKTAALALGFVLAGSLDYDPRLLVIEWRDGAVEALFATSPAICNAAVRAIYGGLWVPVGGREVAGLSCIRPESIR